MATVWSVEIMEDVRKSRAGGVNQQVPATLGKAGSFPNPGGHGLLSKQRQQNHPMYNHTKMSSYPKHSVDDLTRGFSGMNLQAPGFGNNHRPSPQMSVHSSSVSGAGPLPVNNALPFMFNGSLAYPSNMYMQQQNLMSFPAAAAGPGFNPGSYYGYAPPYSECSPTNWLPPSRVPSGDVPSLVAPRRGSSSSNENDLPGTPFTHYTGYGNNVAIMDNSPNSVYTYSTPSPIQARFGVHKQLPAPQIPMSLQLLCQQDPPIPRAVPAPYSPQKPLEQRLVNKHGITNVYIRGLQPDTTDEMLYKLSARFGEIDSSKAIIDHETGSCKGFGFVKYFSFKDAENCIRGFTWCGYETSFARESFYSQLKKLSEPHNTNLYISNLPKNLNEHELASIFNGYKVQSARILRNSDGSGRGVGFARFESRDVCEAVIRDFNNTPVAKPESGEHVIQIRYADTPEQKALKQTTTAARQYRTAEYESQTRPNVGPSYGEHFDVHGGYDQSISSTNAHGRLSALTAHLSPVSTGTTVHVKLPQPSAEDDSTLASSVDLEPTITAGISTNGAHEALKIESVA